jgi:hypothetical protein
MPGTEPIGRSRYGGLHLGGGWYLQWLDFRGRTGVSLTTGHGGTIAFRWKGIRAIGTERGLDIRL